MESARKITSNRGVVSAAVDPYLFIYDPGTNPNFSNFYSGLGFIIQPTILRELNPEVAFPQGSILLASYEARRQLAPSLNTINSHITCILYGQELLPDSIVNQPQIQLITYNAGHVRDYLSAKGVKLMNPQNFVQGSELPGGSQGYSQVMSRPGPS